MPESMYALVSRRTLNTAVRLGGRRWDGGRQRDRRLLDFVRNGPAYSKPSAR
jgi:hypothetical protein